MVAERLSPLPLSVDPKDYPVWDDLDLDILPSGRISRLWVVLAEDAMSTPIRVPVIVAKGVRPGPVVGLVSYSWPCFTALLATMCRHSEP